MNANAVAKISVNLTPEERFRLILAASGRGDEAEAERLAHAAGRISVSRQDHAPFAQAFYELAWLTFIELVEDAARYTGAFQWFDDEAKEEADDNADEPGATDDAEPAKGGAGKRPLSQQTLDLALAAGYALGTKTDGWKLFCERLTVPPFLLVEGFPGFDRLQRALAQAEQAAFTPKGFLRWLNARRSAGEPLMTDSPLTVEGVAAANEDVFRKRVDWWGG
jgi:hypothetical protein